MKNGLLQRFMGVLLALTLLLGMSGAAQAEDEAITAQEMMALLDDYVQSTAPEHLGEWQAMFPQARESDAPLTRADGIFALYCAACTACPDRVALGENWYPLHTKIGEKIWDEYAVNDALFGDLVYQSSPWHEWGCGASAYFFALDVRDMNDDMMFDYDAEANTLHTDAPLTRSDAQQAIARMMNDRRIAYKLGAATIALSQSNPVITSEDHPRWTGLVLPWDDHNGDYASIKSVENTANWGFNSVRILVDYRNLFDPETLELNEENIALLDSFIAIAIKNDIHLNLCFSYLPGREATTFSTYTSVGQFDLFINEEEQVRVDTIWRIIAERYRDVSNYNLSFTPFWEAMNKNLSTGLPVPDYSPEDIAAYLGRVVDVIRESNPDRLIIYEPTGNNGKEDILSEARACKGVADNKGNMIISYNFCE